MSGMKDTLGDTLYESRYPDSPGYKDNGASRDAARRFKITGSKALRIEAHRLLVAALPGGLTTDEIAKKMDRSVLAIRPRVSELVELGKAEKTAGRRLNDSGMTATVYRATGEF